MHQVVTKAAQRAAAEAAIRSIGLGYDLTIDLRLNCCKRSSDVDPHLIALDLHHLRALQFSGGLLIPGVPGSIKCDKGDRTRFTSDLLSFQQMSELFNQDLSLSGKIPPGNFNASFEFTGTWQRDAADTKALALHRVSIALYSIELEKSAVVLRDHIKQAVPTTWDPIALGRFIELYGTHVVVGVRMGGEDAILVKQAKSSNVDPDDLQRIIKNMADKVLVGDRSGSSTITQQYHSALLEDKDIHFIHNRKGGNKDKSLSHAQWCKTVQLDPVVISMSFVPISSLINGVNGSGYLSHAINLYLRYKPPIEELLHFLDFQLPRQWAPALGDLPLGPKYRARMSESLQFSFMGPKLHINTATVDVNKRPVTGLRLFLEGRKSNILALHMQHLSSLPSIWWFENEEHTWEPSTNSRYYEKVRWKSFSGVCTEAVEASDDLSIVTGHHFEVRRSGLKNVLFLCLHFSKVGSATALRDIKWDISPAVTKEAGFVETLMSTHFSTAKKGPSELTPANINSAVYPGGPPVPTRNPKLLKYVDTTEMTRGPQDWPGHWVVSGGRLVVGNGKIALMVKYSLLEMMIPES